MEYFPFYFVALQLILILLVTSVVAVERFFESPRLVKEYPITVAFLGFSAALTFILLFVYFYVSSSLLIMQQDFDFRYLGLLGKSGSLLKTSTIVTFDLFKQFVGDLLWPFSVIIKPFLFLVFLVLAYSVFFAFIKRVDFWLILFFSIFAQFCLLATSDFLMFFIFLEFVSLTFYVLSRLKLTSFLAAEASMKYFVFGSLASVFVLLGISCFYGVFGTLIWNEISLFLLVHPIKTIF
jgi:NADH:ubiquinone oxidoreductase subunit 2 (subunit N)